MVFFGMNLNLKKNKWLIKADWIIDDNPEFIFDILPRLKAVGFFGIFRKITFV